MKYYVYRHTDPDTKDIVYVGKGTGGRAWDVTRARGKHKEHQAWMQGLMSRGYIPTDWVEVIGKGLTEAEAFALEKETLHSIGGAAFNRQSGERNYQAKLTDDQARLIYDMCRKGYSHKILAEDFGVSRSCISMISSRKQWRAATACMITPN